MSDGYCPRCDHPWGYHTPDRGCTMPLNQAGLPASRTDTVSRPCECRQQTPEQVEQERDRLAERIAEIVLLLNEWDDPVTRTERGKPYVPIGARDELRAILAPSFKVGTGGGG